MRFARWIAAGFALAVALSAHAQVKVAGDWHGVLQSPIGPMTLIVTIAEGEQGALRGELASPDQGASRIPITSLTAVDGRLTFTIKPAQISYEGEWAEAEQQWAGTFTQGAKMPLDVTIRKLDGLNHLFQTARTGAIGEYADITETIAPVVLTIATDWINARFSK